MLCCVPYPDFLALSVMSLSSPLASERGTHPVVVEFHVAPGGARITVPEDAAETCSG